MSTTEAAVLFGLNEPLRLTTLRIPALGPGQVLVDVAYSGVCHTQLLEARGKRGPDRFLPHTLGHEGSGVVAQVGPGVSKVKAGDRVVLSWMKGTGMDAPSSQYFEGDRIVHSGAISTFLRRAIVAENRLTAITASMPLREAALLGCAVPTGAGIVFHTARVQEGSSIAIFGMGGIGLSSMLASTFAKAAVRIAVDVLDAKLELARNLGATHVINGRSGDPVARIGALTGGKGVDVAIEAAGRKESMEAAFSSVRNGGGLCILAGNLPFGERIALDPMDLIRGKRIVGTWGGESNPDTDIPTYIAHYETGRLKFDALISREYSLPQINEALGDLEEGRVVRALIDCR